MAKKYLHLTLRRAKNIDATTAMSSGTRVYAKVSYKNIVYTTTKVEDMGLSPVFTNDGSNVSHFVYEDENEYITLELFNRNDNCIGKSKLQLRELARLVPEGDSEEKTLPVMVASPFRNLKQFGELILVAQIKQQEAMGEKGNLNVVLQKGHVEGITSKFGPKTAKINAKLTYKHTTLSSGILIGMGKKFVWHEENSFTFMINTFKPDDVLEIEVRKGSVTVGECKKKISLLINEEDLRADPREVITLTEDLVLNKKKVGSIDLAVSFIKPTIASAPPSRVAHHVRLPIPGIVLYPPQILQHHEYPMEPGWYPPQQHGMHLPAHMPPPSGGLHVPHPAMVAPPALDQPGGLALQREAHGAPPGRAYFRNAPEVADFVQSFH